jgi:hypothetical protein
MQTIARANRVSRRAEHPFMVGGAAAADDGEQDEQEKLVRTEG